ncbi:quinone-dependent dihydroorotate dehydrogenase [Alistipes sp.]|uniref:quinone-dependent dihydroorotate dehydrogenase n=1 Tax=Alistipes sp. TaxID=1872444 RepID=UPI0025BFE583|nr:quinone-dependent dihydroorotate dehydrogenase [Alistipes sp.]MCI7141050.1 quinone-dependent dihydroorotate dehydrogenase [Alistipes sp.]MDY5395862.1 quinone-dependent dihydroorotate dehydrogenase [Alistipes sp.]
MYRKFIEPLLFSLPIERAHRVVLLLLRGIGLIPGGRWLLRRCYTVRHPALEREVFGIRFANPIGLAAGFDRNGEALPEFGALGFGFVEIGTVTPRPQEGNPRPRVFRLTKDRAVVNRIGIANRGLDATVHYLHRGHKGVVLGCNIGKNTDTPAVQAPSDYLKLFRSLYQYADYFTVNVSCDNACHDAKTYTKEHLLEILNPLFDFRRGQSDYRPVMLKISPDLSDREIDIVTEVLTSSPLDGIVATNGSHACRRGLRTSRESLDKIGSGRLSGAPLTQRAIEIVRRIHTLSGGTYPIIGSGGIMTPEDALAMLEAGADLVQVYTGYIYNGPEFVRSICNALIDAESRKAKPAVPAEEGTRGENAPGAAPASAGSARNEDPTQTADTTQAASSEKDPASTK